MRIHIHVLVLVLVLPALADNGHIVPPERPPEQASERAPDGSLLDIVVRDVQGEADLAVAGEKRRWVPVEKGMVLPVGSQLATGVGASVWLAFGANSVAFIRETTIVRIEAFRMEGDELVARVFIDPGVASVSIVQRQQFLTDFRVSTPRLTASIRGSGETVIANGDEQADHVFVDEHFAEVVCANGRALGVTEGGATNSNREAPHDLAARENVADVTPAGATQQETASVETVATTAQSTDVVGSNLTFSQTSNPATGSVEPPPAEPAPPDVQPLLAPEFTPEEALHALGHFILAVGDVETDVSNDREALRWSWEKVYLSEMTMDGGTYRMDGYDSNDFGTDTRDRPPEWDAKGDWSEANHDRLHADGTRSFIEDYLLVWLHEDYHDGWDREREIDPTVAERLHAEFHRDATGEGFDRFAEDLLAAADAAEQGVLDRHALGEVLVDVPHLGWHMDGRKAFEDLATFEAEHARFHEEYLAPLRDKLEHGPHPAFVDGYLDAVHVRWHAETGVGDSPEAGTPEADRHDHFHGHLQTLHDVLVPPSGTGDTPPHDGQPAD